MGYDTSGRANSYTDQQGRNVQIQYDGVGNRTRLQWPTGTNGSSTYFVTYQYDAMNRMTDVLESGTTSLAHYNWDMLSRQTSISYGDGTSNSLWCSNFTSFYSCPDVPNQVAPLTRGNPRQRDVNLGGYSPWFSNGYTTFGDEAIGSFGNVHRDPFHGPGTNNTNLLLAKNFGIGGDNTRRLQIRMESDNVFNHTQFTNPASTYGSGVFGYISGTAAARQTQLAAKFYF